jgi:hypothetical protein
MKIYILLFVVLISSLSIFSQQPATCSTGKDKRIDAGSPTVFVTFERFGKALDLSKQKLANVGGTSHSKEKGEDIWLRVHNNTCWSIKFSQYGMYLPKQREGENPGDRLDRMGILDDGAETGIFYWVVKPNGARTFVGSDSSDFVTLPPGTSLLLSVQKGELAPDHEILVDFHYDWEFNARGRLMNEPAHQLSLRNYEFEEQVKEAKKTKGKN